MDKLTSIRIKYSDGTYLDEVPIGVLVQNVGYDNGHNLIQVLGSVDVESNGTIQQQINRLFNEKLNISDLSSYVNNKITTDVSKWLTDNVIIPTGGTVVVDQSLSISGAAADAKKVGDELTDIKEDLTYSNLIDIELAQKIGDELRYPNNFVRGKRYLASGFANATNYACNKRKYSAGTYRFNTVGISFKVVKYISDSNGEELTSWVSGDRTVTADGDFYISFSNVTSDEILDNINNNFTVIRIFSTENNDLTSKIAENTANIAENTADIEEIRTVIDYVSKGYTFIPLQLNPGYIGATGAINPSTASGEKYTDIIAVESGDKIYIDTKLSTVESQWICVGEYADESFSHRQKLLNNVETAEAHLSYTVPANINGIKICARLYGTGELTAYYATEIRTEIEEITSKMKVFYSIENTVKSIAHRGDDITAPQNTAPAYIAARKNGFEIAENDVWYSEDGYYVMEHDTSLRRLGDMVDINGYLMYTDGTAYYWVDSSDNSVYTWNGTEYVASSTALSSLTRCNGSNYGVNSTYDVIGLNLDVLKRIDFGVYKDQKFKGTQILTFEEWVLLCKQLGMEIYIDRKFNYTTEQITDLANIVKKYGMGNKASWLGMDGAKIIALRSIIPESRCCLLQHPSEALIEAYTPYNVGRGFFFNGDARTMTKEAIQLGLSAGFDVEVWFVDYGNKTEDQIYETIREAVSYGVTGMSLDHYRVNEAFTYMFEEY